MEESTGGENVGYATMIASVAALGGFLFGFDSGVINGAVTAISNAFDSSTVGTGFSVASMLLGCAAGALVAGPGADRMGRRKMMLITAIGFAVSAWGSGVATGATEFVLYRLIGGVAVGAASVLAPAYISEIAPPRLRGRLASLQQMAIVLGLLGAFLSNYFIAQIAGGAEAEWLLGHAAWRWMFWVEVAPSILLFVGTLFIPESPRYLVAAGKLTESHAVFAKLSGVNAARMVESVKATLDLERTPRFSDIKSPAGNIYPLVWVGMILSVFQQFVGINVVFYYGEVLWRAAGFTESEALQVNLLSGCVNVGSTVVALFLIDKIGRKPLLLAGSAGMFLSLGFLACCFVQGTTGDNGALQLSDTLGFLALVSANLYVFAFGVSWGPCVWVLLGEMFPNQYRAAALSLGAAVQWVANFVVTMTFPLLLTGFGLGVSYGLYASLAALSFFFVSAKLKETKGCSLEEMG